MSVAEAQEKISSREFAEWIAFARIEPIGDARADLRMGILAASMVNMWCGKKARAKPQDFIPNFDRAKQEDWRSMKHKMMMVAAIHNKKVTQHGDSR